MITGNSLDSRKQVLVLGAGGMAGHVIATYLRELQIYDVTTLSARNSVDEDTFLIDVFDINAFDSFLDLNSFDVIINCIGSLIQSSEERKDRSVFLNAYLPHFLEHKYSNSYTRIIHLSTDCVFSGKNPPYREDSQPDGELFYDRSKFLGEIVNNKDLTFRMSIVGPDSQREGVGLFNWFYAQRGEIFGFTKSIWNGVTTITLAHAIDEAIKQNVSGLYHLVPEISVSKFDLLELFRSVFSREDITILPKPGVASDKSLTNSRTDFQFLIPSYLEQITQMREWVENHPSYYPHYLRNSL